MKKRILALLLVMVMVVSVFPVQALAEDMETIAPGDVKEVTLAGDQEITYTFVPAETAEYTFWNASNTNSYYCWLYEDGKILTNGNAHFAFDAKAGSVYEFNITTRDGSEAAFSLHLEKNVPAYSVKMRSSQVVMLKGERRSFPLTFDPVNSIRGEYSWTLSDDHVATIASHFNSGCDVIANTAGTTTLTVNVGGVQASCEITVMDTDSMERLSPGDVRTIEMDPGEVMIFQFDPTNTAQYTLWNENGFNGYFFTIYEGTRRIENGNCPVAFQAQYGTPYFIHVRNEGMETATYEMHLEENVPMISASMDAERKLPQGETGFVSLNYNPFNSIRGDVQWSVDDSSVVKLESYFDGGCNFEAVSTGTATLKAVVAGEILTCKITVSCGHQNLDNNICQDCGIKTGKCGEDLYWFLNHEGELFIWGTGRMTEYAYNEVPWRPYRGDIKTVIVEDGVESICACAFFECQNMTEVMLPDSVTSIGMSAFRFCDGLKTVDLPDDLTMIASNLFSGCDGLETIVIPDGVTCIGESAFNGCTGLKSVVIPAGVTRLEKWAFSACMSMTKMEFTGDAPAIAEDAFTYVAATAVYPADNPTWNSAVLQNYGGNIKWNCGTVTDKEFIVIDDEQYWITEDMTLTDNILVAESASVYIEEGVTVTVPAGVELNIEGYVEVYGNLIFEEGSILTITDERYQRLCIWTGKLNVSGADISGVPYGAVELQLNSSAEVIGIPDEMLYASIYVYSTEEVNAALEKSADYEILLLMVDSSFTLTNSITIPDNAELFIWRWNDEADCPSVVIPSGITVTNNGWLTLGSGRFVAEQGSTLINNKTLTSWDTMLVFGEFLQNGTVYGDIYRKNMSQKELQEWMDYCAENGYGWTHENETILTSNMTIDLGEKNFEFSKYGSIIIPGGTTLTVQSFLDTGVRYYGNLECGKIIVQNGGKLVINSDLQTHETAKTELILEEGAMLEINGQIFANDSIEIGKNAVVEVNGYWIGYAPINNGGTILPAVKGISVSADDDGFDVETTDYIELHVTVDDRSEENLIPGAIAGATWSSSDPEIIDPEQISDFSEGTYRAYLGGKTGTVTLTATSIDGSGKTASITLQITGPGNCNGAHVEVIDEAVPPTCTTTGLSEGKHCSACGEVLKAQTVVRPTGHCFEDGMCKACDLPEPGLGDVDGDGGIDAKDAVQLLWYALFPSQCPENFHADFNHDGETDLEDAEYLIWYTLFPSVYPL